MYRQRSLYKRRNKNFKGITFKASLSRRILKKKIRSLSPRLLKKEKQQLKAKIVFELRPKHPLKMLLEIAKMSRGSYLYQLWKAPSKCLDIVYSEQIAAIKKIHSDSKERYGDRRVMYALRNQGYI